MTHRAAVAKSIRELRASRTHGFELGFDPRALLRLQIVLGKIDRAFDLCEHSERAALELGDTRPELTREIRLRETPRTITSRMNDIEQRLRSHEVELAVRDRTP